MASYKQFGDPQCHPPWTAFSTLSQLASIHVPVDDIKAYAKAAMVHCLNGVHKPFWCDWPLSQPNVFLTPEPLHHWHKQFWDHDAKWCIRVLGDAEIDFRFLVLHPSTGYRHFTEGIVNLKQVTGREHRNIEWYLVGVIAGAMPHSFLIVIRALMDFRYLAQAPQISDTGCREI